MTFADEVLADTPAVYYKFEDAGGAVCTDSSGNGHDGAYENAPTLAVEGLTGAGSAIRLVNTFPGQNATADPAGQRVRIPEAEWTFPDGDFSVEFVAKTEYPAVFPSFGMLPDEAVVAKRGQFAANFESGELGDNNAMLPGITIGTASDALNAKSTAGWGYVDDWLHFVLTAHKIDAANYQFTMYTNGVQTSQWTEADMTAYYSGANGHDTYIGGNFDWVTGPADNFYPYGNMQFTGSIDEVVFYESVLAPERVTAHATALGFPVNAVPYDGSALAAIEPVQDPVDYGVSWQPWAFYAMDAAAFDAGSGNNFLLPDLSGKGHDEVLGSSSFKVAEPGGEPLLAGAAARPSARFIKSGYYAQFAHDPGLYKSPLFKTTSVLVRFATEYERGIIMGCYDSSYEWPYWEIGVKDSKVYFKYATAKNGSQFTFSETLSAADIVLGTAYTLGFSVDDTNIYLYIDGALDTTIPLTTVFGLNVTASTVLYSMAEMSSGALPQFRGNMAAWGLYPYAIPASVHKNFHILSTSADAKVVEDMEQPTPWGDGDPAAAVVTSAYGQAVLASDPLVYYRLGEAVGTQIMRDSSGNGHDGGLDLAGKDYPGSVPFSGYVSPTPGQPSLDPGTPDTAVKYPGMSLSSAVIGGGAPSNAWTIEAIVNDDGSFRTGRRYIAGANFRVTSNPASYSKDGAIALAVDGTKVLALINDPNNLSGDYSGWYGVTVDDHAGPGATYHYAATMDGSTLKLYVGGVMVGSVDITAALSGTWATAPLDDFAINSNTSTGASNYIAGIGVIDEVALYPVALDDATIASHFANLGIEDPPPYVIPPPEPSPIRGTIFTEDFENGGVGDIPSLTNTAFTTLTDDANAEFVADGQSGQGMARKDAAADGSTVLNFTDSYVTNAILYHRAFAKFVAPDLVSGAAFVQTVMQGGVYLNETYASYYPTGLPALALSVKGKGGQLSNDSYAGAEPLEVGVESAVVNVLASSTTPRWYRYTPSADGTIVIHGVNHGTDIVMDMGTGADEASFTVIVSDDDSFGNSQPQITQAVTSGTTYYFRVYGWSVGPGSVIIDSGPAANNAPVGDGGPITFDWNLAVTDDTAAAQNQLLCPAEPDTWYLIEMVQDGSTSLVTARISDVDGNLLIESDAMPVISLAALGLSGPSYPYSMNLSPSNLGTAKVTVDGAAISDTDWVGLGGSAAGVPLTLWDGAERVALASLGWYDGADVQGVTIKGWYDGVDVQGLV